MDLQKTMEFIVEQQAHFASGMEELKQRQKESEERHNREMAQIRQELRRGIRLSVEEHRRERVRRHSVEAEQTALRAGLDELRATLEAYIKSLKNGR